MKHNKTIKKKNMSDNKFLRTVYYTYTVQNKWWKNNKFKTKTKYLTLVTQDFSLI